MDNAKSFMESTAPATEGLFKLLNQYGWQKMRALVDTVNSKTLDELKTNKVSYSSTDVAREVISGSIMQIAFVALKEHAKPSGKSPGALHFETEINRIIQENPGARTKQFTLPSEFCIGREIGDLPIGLIIYAARNQFNHAYESRLSVINEVIFNQLHNMWPDPPKELSFDLYNDNYYYCYSALVALGWNDGQDELGYKKYKRDLSEIFEIEF